MIPSCLFPYDARSDTCRACHNRVECRRLYRRRVEGKKLDDVMDRTKMLRAELIECATGIATRMARTRDYVCGPDVQDECRQDEGFLRLWEDLRAELGGAEPDWRFLGAVFRQKGLFVPYCVNGQQYMTRIASHSRPAACWLLVRGE